MKHRRTLAAAALLAAAMVVGPRVAQGEDLSVDPSSWNFGMVPQGASRTRSFTVASLGPSEVWVYLIELTPEASAAQTCGTDVACDFAIITSPAIPRAMPPGETGVVEVTFTPSAIGSRNAFLYVASNDSVGPPGPEAFLPLTGVGGASAAPVPAVSWAGMAMVVAVLAALGALGVLGLQRIRT